MTPAELQSVQKLLGDRFVAKRIIGRGGMAAVVLARQVALERDVAIKLLFDGLRKNPSAFARFIREAKVCARWSHPNIVAVHDVNEASGFIVMEYVPGQTAKERLLEQGKLDCATVANIGREILEALKMAHAAGVVHRDIKPSNILLEEDGAIKLADFGIAFVAETPLTQAGHVVGTPAYMAPEQLRGSNVDGRADLYGLGSTLFELATGQKLHTQTESVKDPMQAVLSATEDADLAYAISVALASDPDDRFQSAEHMQDALENVGTMTKKLAPLDVPQTSGTPPPAPSERTAPRALRPFFVAMGFALATTLGVGALVSAARSKPLSGPVRIGIVPFGAPDGRPDLAYVRTGLPELIDTELDATSGVDVIRPEILEHELPRLQPQTADWLSAARSFGASAVATGEVEAEGSGRLRLTTQLLSNSGAELEAWEVSLSPEDLAAYFESHAAEIAAAAKEHAVDADLNYLRALGRGVEALGEHHLHDAILEFKKAQKLNPQGADAPYYRSIASWWAELPSDETQLAIETCLKLDPGATRRAFLEGLKLLISHQWQAAAGYFEKLHALHPRDRAVMYGLFEARFHGGQVAEAAALYRKMVGYFPRFRLGARHALTYATVQVDEELMAWALEHVEGDDLYLEWEARRLVARREYSKALTNLTRATADESLSRNAKSRLTSALLQTRMLAGHEAVVSAHLKRSGGSNIMIEHALAELHGDTSQVASKRADLVAWAKTQKAKGVRSGVDIVMRTIMTELATANPGDLTALMDGLNGLADERDNGNPRIDLLRAFVAIQVESRDLLASLKLRPHQQTQAVAAGGLLLLDGQHAEAAASFEQAVRAAGDGRFVGASQYFRAMAAAKAGDDAAAIQACDEVLRPRLFEWSWAGYVGPCLLISAEASAELKDYAASKRFVDRLLVLRGAAGEGDPLLLKARALGR